MGQGLFVYDIANIDAISYKGEKSPDDAHDDLIFHVGMDSKRTRPKSDAFERRLLLG